MAYAFRYLSTAEQADIKASAIKKPVETAPDESLQRAWEADLAAHQALHTAATGDEKKAHAEAIKTLEAALNAAAKSG